MPENRTRKHWEPTLHTDLLPGHLAWTEKHDDPGLYHYRAAHQQASEVAKRLVDARKAALDNTMQTRPANLRGYALTREKAVASALKTVQASLDRGRAELEQVRSALNAPIAQPKNPSTAAEIRAHLKGLSREKRAELLDQAIAQGDEETVAAALSGPGYLAGFEPHESEQYRTQYQRARNPDGWKRLRSLEKAQEVAERTGERLVDFSTEIHHADNAELRDAVASEQRAREALEGM